MAFSDPIKVKIDGSTEVECPRVDTGNFASQYTSSDGLVNVKLATTNGRRRRHVARIDQSKITTDPFDTTQNEEVSASAYIVIDRPLSGFTAEELKKQVEGLCTFLTASSAASLKKLLGSES
jgi:hypothetical protein